MGYITIFTERISIHALCEEGDVRSSCFHILHIHFYPRPLRGGRLRLPRGVGRVPHISIHALCEEGDLRMLLNSALISLFLSTPSARRATLFLFPFPASRRNFYPRPLRGGRQKLLHRAVKAIEFLSTPSARRATWMQRWP